MLPNNERRISLSQAASRYPGARGADRMHPASLTRQILLGAKGRNGDRVKLEAEKIGCRWFTSEESLARFAAALVGEVPSVPTRTDSQARRAAEAADRRLAASGA